MEQAIVSMELFLPKSAAPARDAMSSLQAAKCPAIEPHVDSGLESPDSGSHKSFGTSRSVLSCKPCAECIPA